MKLSRKKCCSASARVVLGRRVRSDLDGLVARGPAGSPGAARGSAGASRGSRACRRPRAVTGRAEGAPTSPDTSSPFADSLSVMRLADSLSKPTLPPPVTLMGANAAGSQIDERFWIVKVWTTVSPVVIGASVRGRWPDDAGVRRLRRPDLAVEGVEGREPPVRRRVGLATSNAISSVWLTRRPRMSTSGLRVTRVPPLLLVSRSHRGASPAPGSAGPSEQCRDDRDGADLCRRAQDGGRDGARGRRPAIRVLARRATHGASR